MIKNLFRRMVSFLLIFDLMIQGIPVFSAYRPIAAPPCLFTEQALAGREVQMLESFAIEQHASTIQSIEILSQLEKFSGSYSAHAESMFILILQLLHIRGMLTAKTRVFSFLSGAGLFEALYASEMWSSDSMLSRADVLHYFNRLYDHVAVKLGSHRSMLPPLKELGRIYHDQSNVFDKGFIAEWVKSMRPGDLVSLRFTHEFLGRNASGDEVKKWFAELVEQLPTGVRVMIFEHEPHLKLFSQGLSAYMLNTKRFIRVDDQLFSNPQDQARWETLRTRTDLAKTDTRISLDKNLPLGFVSGGTWSILEKKSAVPLEEPGFAIMPDTWYGRLFGHFHGIERLDDAQLRDDLRQLKENTQRLLDSGRIALDSSARDAMERPLEIPAEQMANFISSQIAPWMEMPHFISIFDKVWPSWQDLKKRSRKAGVRRLWTLTRGELNWNQVKFAICHPSAYVGKERINLNPKGKTPREQERILQIILDLNHAHKAIYENALAIALVALKQGITVEWAQLLTETAIAYKHGEVHALRPAQAQREAA